MHQSHVQPCLLQRIQRRRLTLQRLRVDEEDREDLRADDALDRRHTVRKRLPDRHAAEGVAIGRQRVRPAAGRRDLDELKLQAPAVGGLVDHRPPAEVDGLTIADERDGAGGRLPDGDRLATVSADRTVRLWSAATGQLEAIYRGHDGHVESVAFHPSGRHLATGGAMASCASGT